MSGEVLILLMFVGMIVGIFMGAPIAFVLGTLSIVFGLIGWGPDSFQMFVIRIWGVMQNFVLVAIPLFVFMGFVLEKAGLAEDLYDSMEALIGRRVRGGLAIGTIAFSTIIATCTGIVATAVVTAGVLSLPSMFKRGYNKELAMGSVAAGGTLGILIPPSIMLIFYAAESGMSAGKLFLAAFGPGFLLSAIYMTYIGIICTVRPQLAPAPAEGVGAVSFREYLRLFKGIIPVLGLILCVLGVIILGIATPTEAAGTGALGSLIVAAAHRRLNWRLVWDSALRTMENVGMMGLIISGAVSFASVFLGLGGEDIVMDVIDALGLGPIGVVAFALIIVFFLGMLIDWVGILYICLPLFLSLVEVMEINPLWFALLICVMLQTAWLTPPFGFSLFFLRSIVPPEITFGSIIRSCLPFVGLQILGIILLIIFPKIIVWLPSLVYK
ncbi:MAG: TRAP transporter large permease subunit [Deltaproteobacteria bacterium]|nr:TRAP transporter large permease subunit [Deltaproteobacteria bacterium]